MKATSHSLKVKTAAASKTGRVRAAAGDLFLGYKALHELRILMRIASTADGKTSKQSY